MARLGFNHESPENETPARRSGPDKSFQVGPPPRKRGSNTSTLARARMDPS
ncbi:MAG: hypothetical protein MI923_17685 [Phycisphaerales bacterium]|nr:hypothetical protein [Phycisphaerales bacterium]